MVRWFSIIPFFLPKYNEDYINILYKYTDLHWPCVHLILNKRNNKTLLILTKNYR